MPDDASVLGVGSLKRIQEQVERLVDHPSPLLDLGFALAGERAPVDEEACEACMASLPGYVEDELNGRPVRREMREVARHIEACPRCEEVYVELLELGLATDTAPLPMPATQFSFNLSFLPPLNPLEQLRAVVEAMVKGLARQWVDAQVDLAGVIPEFFSKAQALGLDMKLQPAKAFALGFGGELPPALQLLAATYSTTYAAIHALSVKDLMDEMKEDNPARILKKHARRSAQDAGFSRREARRWAELYVDHARRHAAEILELARLLKHDEQPDK